MSVLDFESSPVFVIDAEWLSVRDGAVSEAVPVSTQLCEEDTVRSCDSVSRDTDVDTVGEASGDPVPIDRVSVAENETVLDSVAVLVKDCATEKDSCDSVVDSVNVIDDECVIERGIMESESVGVVVGSLVGEKLNVPADTLKLRVSFVVLESVHETSAVRVFVLDPVRRSGVNDKVCDLLSVPPLIESVSDFVRRLFEIESVKDAEGEKRLAVVV